MIEPWIGLIRRAAAEYDIPVYILAGLVISESSGNPYAIRVERGFWRRYSNGIMRWVRSTPSSTDNRWARYPDIYAASYGLCQIMLQTAAENGFKYRFPTELLDPETNVDLAARILRKHHDRSGSWSRALLRYNGGGDPAYPSRVMANGRPISEIIADTQSA